MVDERAGAGDRRAVCGVSLWRGSKVAGTSDPVWRLCGVAAGVAAGRGTGAADWILEGSAGGGVTDSGAAAGRRAACEAESQRREPPVRDRGGSVREVEGSK